MRIRFDFMIETDVFENSEILGMIEKALREKDLAIIESGFKVVEVKDG